MKKSLLYGHAVQLRQEGYSYKEIRKKLGIAKSTAHLWTKEIAMSEEANVRLMNVGKIGRAKSLVTIRNKIACRNEAILEIAKLKVSTFEITKDAAAIICALLYWAEGAKRYGLCFTNSDPKMVSLFLRMFRIAFPVDERHLRAVVHLHEYHDVETQCYYWSNVTGIPREKIKIYLKPHTGKNTRLGYPGCIQINYHDVRIFTELKMIYNELAN